MKQKQLSALHIKISIYKDEFMIFHLDKMRYIDRCLLQGLLWLNEVSAHNDIDEECCPDFSCCEPDLFEIDKSKRQKTIDNFYERSSIWNTIRK